MAQKIIPVFPLSVSIVPGQKISLHIFEDRYKQLIEDCSTQDPANPFLNFGICYLTADGLSSIGCSVRISSVLKRFKDGRLDILVEGVSRFSVIKLLEEGIYDRAQVEFIKDPVVDILKIKGGEEFMEMHMEMCVLAGTKNVIKPGKIPLSFQSAFSINLGDHQKQILLELAGEQDRITWLTELYQAVLNKIKSGGSRVVEDMFDLDLSFDQEFAQIH